MWNNLFRSSELDSKIPLAKWTYKNSAFWSLNFKKILSGHWRILDFNSVSRFHSLCKCTEFMIALLALCGIDDKCQDQVIGEMNYIRNVHSQNEFAKDFYSGHWHSIYLDLPGSNLVNFLMIVHCNGTGFTTVLRQDFRVMFKIFTRKLNLQKIIAFWSPTMGINHWINLNGLLPV